MFGIFGVWLFDYVSTQHIQANSAFGDKNCQQWNSQVFLSIILRVCYYAQKCIKKCNVFCFVFCMFLF